MNYLYIIFIILPMIITNVISSPGDRSQYFQNCVNNCLTSNCSTDGINFNDVTKHKMVHNLLLWACRDECQYECMWKTTELFIQRNWYVPQFYGKWPFIRVLGIQEPASVLFSIFNFLAHYKMIQKFRKEVRKDTPLYKVWHVFSFIAMNGWLWSIVFHTRDFPITELLDYTFAYSIVLTILYCTLLRVLYKKSFMLKMGVTVLAVFYFLNHFAYLSVGRFDYDYNMKANIFTGLITTVIWITWYLINRKTNNYSWKILLFTCLTGLSLLLELNDFQPILYIFDAHSLWHLSTVPLTFLFYSFIIDDCKYLRVEKFKMNEKTT